MFFFPCGFFYTFNPGFLEFFVTHTESRIIGDEEREGIALFNVEYFTGMVFVNGFGSFRGPIYTNLRMNFEHSYWIECFKYNGEPQYGNCLDNVKYINNKQNFVNPNPVKGELNFDFSLLPAGNKKVKIINITGQVVKSFETTEKNTIINIECLRAGIYLVQIKTENNKIYSQKIIKQ